MGVGGLGVGLLFGWGSAWWVILLVSTLLHPTDALQVLMHIRFDSRRTVVTILLATYCSMVWLPLVLVQWSMLTGALN